MSANKQYSETRKIINNQIDILRAKLESMDIEQSKDIKNLDMLRNFIKRSHFIYNGFYNSKITEDLIKLHKQILKNKDPEYYRDL